MALASRLLSRSTRQLYSSQLILQPEHAVPVRFFAKEATPQALKGDQAALQTEYMNASQLSLLPSDDIRSSLCMVEQLRRNLIK